MASKTAVNFCLRRPSDALHPGRSRASTQGGATREYQRGRERQPDLYDDQVLAVQDALDKLGAVQPRKVEIVKLRYFAG